MLRGFERCWEELDSGLPEVLPTELVGWLMLRRSGLSSQQRLNVLSSIVNSLRAEDVERGLRGAEDELRVHEREQVPKGHGKKGTHRPVFWMEHQGEWSLLTAAEEDMEDWVQDAHWIGDTSALSMNYGVFGMYTPPSTSQGEGTWYQDGQGSYIPGGTMMRRLRSSITRMLLAPIGPSRIGMHSNSNPISLGAAERA